MIDNHNNSVIVIKQRERIVYKKELLVVLCNFKIN